MNVDPSRVTNVDAFEVSHTAGVVSIQFTDIFGTGASYALPLSDALDVSMALVEVLRSALEEAVTE